MDSNNCNSSCGTKCGKTCLTIVVCVVTFLLMGFLVNRMVKLTRPEPVGVARATERAVEGAKIRADGVEKSKSWGLVDQPRGIVRLPVEDAVKLTLEGYKDAAKFKTDLAARLEKASVAPPKPKNDYE
jgi:hypothetical protein